MLYPILKTIIHADGSTEILVTEAYKWALFCLLELCTTLDMPDLHDEPQN